MSTAGSWVQGVPAINTLRQVPQLHRHKQGELQGWLEWLDRVDGLVELGKLGELEGQCGLSGF